MRNGAYLRGVFYITLGGLAAKGIGALYRIPLANALQGYGMGLYQMAYPLFLVLLTFSSAGIPSAFSRIIAAERAGGREDGGTISTALKLFAALGVLGTLMMCALAPLLSAAQGDIHLRGCYLALAPSVFLVACIAVLRGYFQGCNDMLPTAASEVVEQLVKAGAGMLLAFHFREDPAAAARGALLAVTFSELAALGYLFLRYARERHTPSLRVRRPKAGEIFSSALPVMAASALLPLSQMADSVIIVRLLGGGARAVTLYGLFSGGAISLIGIPATLSYGFGAAAVPAVSSAFARGDRDGGRRRAVYALALTLACSLPAALGLYLFAGPIVRFLYPALGEDAVTLVSLVRICALSAAALAGVDTLAACLTGMGRAKYAAFSMLLAVAVKAALQILLVSNPAFSIRGAAIAANACYLVAFSLDLFYTVRKTKKEKTHDNHREFGDSLGRLDPAGAPGDTGGG